MCLSDCEFGVVDSKSIILGAKNYVKNQEVIEFLRGLDWLKGEKEN